MTITDIAERLEVDEDVVYRHLQRIGWIINKDGLDILTESGNAHSSSYQEVLYWDVYTLQAIQAFIRSCFL